MRKPEFLAGSVISQPKPDGAVIRYRHPFYWAAQQGLAENAIKNAVQFAY